MGEKPDGLLKMIFSELALMKSCGFPLRGQVLKPFWKKSDRSDHGVNKRNNSPMNSNKNRSRQ